MTERELEEMAERLRQIDRDGFAWVDCDACGAEIQAEPDADYPCPECGEGMIHGPLNELIAELSSF